MVLVISGGDDAREHIGRPAGRERRNDANRLRRIRLGPAADRGARRDARDETDTDNGEPYPLFLVLRMGRLRLR